MGKVIYKVEDKIEALKPLLDSVNFDEEEGIEEIEIKSQEIIGDIMYSMRCSREYNFFSLMMDKINVLIDVHLTAPMACGFKRNHYEMYINPFITFGFDKYYIRAFLIHELYHVIMNHIPRSKKFIDSGEYTHAVCNIGLDVAINQYITPLDEDPDFCNISSLAQLLGVKKDDIEPNKECEYYIEKLKKSNINQPTPKEFLEQLKNEMNNQLNNNNEDNQDQQDENKEETQNGQNQDNSSGKGKPVAKSVKSCNHFIYDDAAGIGEHVLKELLKDVSNKCRGLTPNGLEQILEEINQEPIIRWQDVLKNYLGRLPIPFKRTSTRLNRRMPYRLDVQGKLPDAYYKIVIAVDTSGSMSDEDVQMCFSEIWNIIQTQKKKFDITVICCDCQINQIYSVKKKRDFKNIKRVGYGGTEFSPVFEYLRENKGKYKDSVVIYFTDGWGENVLRVKPLNNNNIWVLTDKTENLSLEKSYGRVLELHLDELKKKYMKGA